MGYQILNSKRLVKKKKKLMLIIRLALESKQMEKKQAMVENIDVKRLKRKNMEMKFKPTIYVIALQ